MYYLWTFSDQMGGYYYYYYPVQSTTPTSSTSTTTATSTTTKNFLGITSENAFEVMIFALILVALTVPAALQYSGALGRSNKKQRFFVNYFWKFSFFKALILIHSMFKIIFFQALLIRSTNLTILERKKNALKRCYVKSKGFPVEMNFSIKICKYVSIRALNKYFWIFLMRPCAIK